MLSYINIKRVKTITYLRLYIDFQLKWRIRYDYIVNLWPKFFYVFWNLKSISEKQLQRIIYILFVQLVINYGIEIWGGGTTYDINLGKVQLTINKIT